MPKLNRELIRTWLDDHNWTITRLTAECNALGEDTFTEGTLRNAVNGIDPMRPGRIKVICRVLARYGDGVPYERLVALEGGGHEPGPIPPGVRRVRNGTPEAHANDRMETVSRVTCR